MVNVVLAQEKIAPHKIWRKVVRRDSHESSDGSVTPSCRFWLLMS